MFDELDFEAFGALVFEVEGEGDVDFVGFAGAGGEVEIGGRGEEDGGRGVQEIEVCAARIVEEALGVGRPPRVVEVVVERGEAGVGSGVVVVAEAMKDGVEHVHRG